MAKPKKPELLSPAGDWTMLHGVIQNGADAVYLGIDELNMRVKADNFRLDELPEITALCRKKKVRTQLVLNIILFDHELPQAEEIIRKAKENRIDSIVCWDLAAASLCKQHRMPFCISTQASIANSLSAKQYELIGASRIVLARECSLEQIKNIKAATSLEIETFIHGAMCIAISGRCFMSHEAFGRSANRGDCLQSCRREYEIYDRAKDTKMFLGTNYVLSSKDLCALDFLDRLIEAGIDSFKIEGRKRSPEYAARTTAVYREAIDAYFRKELTAAKKGILLNQLAEVYNRGFCEGFYLETPSTDGFAEFEGNASITKKEFLGRVENYYSKTRIAYIEVQAGSVKEGDNLLILGKTSGVVEIVLSSMIVNEQPAKSAKKNDFVTFPCPTRVRTGDRVYKIINT